MNIKNFKKFAKKPCNFQRVAMRIRMIDKYHTFVILIAYYICRGA